jgi:predicted MPP superfamily phosphohydrolase
VTDLSQVASRVRSIGRGFAVTAGAGTAAAFAATAYGLWEKNQFVLREETVPILPAGRAPFRILHLSDIHFVPGQKAKAEWLQSLAALRPDLVVNTGDNLSHPKAVIRCSARWHRSWSSRACLFRAPMTITRRS